MSEMHLVQEGSSYIKKNQMGFDDLVDVQWGPKSIKLYEYGANTCKDMEIMEDEVRWDNTHG